MAELFSPSEIRNAIQGLVHAQGILVLAVHNVEDGRINGGDMTPTADAIHGAIQIIERAWCMLAGAGEMVQEGAVG